jgi:hypothetical protein
MLTRRAVYYLQSMVWILLSPLGICNSAGEESQHIDLCQVYFYLNFINPSAANFVPANYGSQDFPGLIEKTT